MRLGPALLVVLLPLLARADYTSTSKEDDTIQNQSSAHSSNSVSSLLSKPISSTSKSSSSTNTIPLDKLDKITNNKNITKLKDVVVKLKEETAPTQHIDKPYTTETLQADSHKLQPSNKKKNLTIGYLTAVKGDLKERQGLSVSGAFTMALKEVNILMA